MNYYETIYQAADEPSSHKKKNKNYNHFSKRSIFHPQIYYSPCFYYSVKTKCQEMLIQDYKNNFQGKLK